MKEFWHTEVLKDRLTLLFNAKDTTRDAQFSYEILIDGLPHEIPPLLRERANNSIKLNPTGMWTHTWQVRSYPCKYGCGFTHLFHLGGWHPPDDPELCGAGPATSTFGA